MKYSVNKAVSEPAYLQLYKELRKDIAGEIYHYQDRLPSKRELAEDTGTSVITTDHAYQLLQEEGYIEARQRSGYYVIYKKDENFPVGEDDTDQTAQENSKSSAHPGSITNIAHQNQENDQNSRGGEGKIHAKAILQESPAADQYWNPVQEFPFATFAKTMRQVLSMYGERILVKSPNFGIPELRQTITAYLARSRGIQVSAGQVIIGSGSEYMYSLIVQMLGRNRLFGLEDPSYPQIQRVYEACGARTQLLAMGPSGIRSSALRHADADVLHITPFHSYPSGVTADITKRNEYIRWAAEKGAMIVEDDMDSEFTMSTKAEDTVFSLEPTRTVIYMNTFSRTIAPSMRCGYMVLPSALADELKEKIAFYSCTVPVFDQYVLTEFIRSGEFERHINRVRRKLRRNHP